MCGLWPFFTDGWSSSPVNSAMPRTARSAASVRQYAIPRCFLQLYSQSNRRGSAKVLGAHCTPIVYCIYSNAWTHQHSTVATNSVISLWLAKAKPEKVHRAKLPSPQPHVACSSSPTPNHRLKNKWIKQNMGLVHAMPHDRNHEHNFPEQASQAATTS